MHKLFRRKRKLYLVFEYVDHTILEELEENPSGLNEETARKHVFQVVRAIQFCHQNNVSLIFSLEPGCKSFVHMIQTNLYRTCHFLEA